jgi:hypothetical protein
MSKKFKNRRPTSNPYANPPSSENISEGSAIGVPDTIAWGDMMISKDTSPEMWQEYANRLQAGEKPPGGYPTAPMPLNLLRGGSTPTRGNPTTNSSNLPAKRPALLGVPPGTIREPLFGRNKDGSPKPRPPGMTSEEVAALSAAQERKYNPPQKTTKASSAPRTPPPAPNPSRSLLPPGTIPQTPEKQLLEYQARINSPKFAQLLPRQQETLKSRASALQEQISTSSQLIEREKQQSLQENANPEIQKAKLAVGGQIAGRDKNGNPIIALPQGTQRVGVTEKGIPIYGVPAKGVSTGPAPQSAVKYKEPPEFRANAGANLAKERDILMQDVRQEQAAQMMRGPSKPGAAGLRINEPTATEKLAAFDAKYNPPSERDILLKAARQEQAASKSGSGGAGLTFGPTATEKLAEYDAKYNPPSERDILLKAARQEQAAQKQAASKPGAAGLRLANEPTAMEKLAMFDAKKKGKALGYTGKDLDAYTQKELAIRKSEEEAKRKSEEQTRKTASQIAKDPILNNAIQQGVNRGMSEDEAIKYAKKEIAAWQSKKEPPAFRANAGANFRDMLAENADPEHVKAQLAAGGQIVGRDENGNPKIAMPAGIVKADFLHNGKPVYGVRVSPETPAQTQSKKQPKQNNTPARDILAENADPEHVKAKLQAGGKIIGRDKNGNPEIAMPPGIDVVRAGFANGKPAYGVRVPPKVLAEMQSKNQQQSVALRSANERALQKTPEPRDMYGNKVKLDDMVLTGGIKGNLGKKIDKLSQASNVSGSGSAGTNTSTPTFRVIDGQVRAFGNTGGGGTTEGTEPVTGMR